jgi:hypothetical protein
VPLAMAASLEAGLCSARIVHAQRTTDGGGHIMTITGQHDDALRTERAQRSARGASSRTSSASNNTPARRPRWRHTPPPPIIRSAR